MKSLNIVAHPDDDLLFMNPDIISDLNAGGEPYILYMTVGDDGNDIDYVLNRKEAIKYAWGPKQAERLIFWPIKSNSFRNGDKVGDLYRMYKDPLYLAESYYGDLAMNQKSVMEGLQKYYTQIQPDIIRIHNPYAAPAIEAGGPELDHIDHIYAAKLAVMSLWNAKSEIYGYEGYPITAKPANVSELGLKVSKKNLWKQYQ